MNWFIKELIEIFIVFIGGALIISITILPVFFLMNKFVKDFDGSGFGLFGYLLKKIIR